MRSKTVKFKRSIESAFDEFLAEKAADGLSPATLKCYRGHFEAVGSYLDAETPIEQVTDRQVKLAVAALPAFAVGSFEGGSETAGAENRTTLSITSAGKISGKIAYANATWTASAAGFTSKTADGLFATLTLKNGKKKGTEEICISSLGAVTASRFTARQLLWTTDDTWKGWATALAGRTFTNERTGVVATFGKNGVATGVLKVGKSTFTAKATLVPTAIDEHNLEGVLYFSFPANSTKKFKGLACQVGVEGLAK